MDGLDLPTELQIHDVVLTTGDRLRLGPFWVDDPLSALGGQAQGFSELGYPQPGFIVARR